MSRSESVHRHQIKITWFRFPMHLVTGVVIAFLLTFLFLGGHSQPSGFPCSSGECQPETMLLRSAAKGQKACSFLGCDQHDARCTKHLQGHLPPVSRAEPELKSPAKFRFLLPQFLPQSAHVPRLPGTLHHRLLLPMNLINVITVVLRL